MLLGFEPLSRWPSPVGVISEVVGEEEVGSGLKRSCAESGIRSLAAPQYADNECSDVLVRGNLARPGR